MCLLERMPSCVATLSFSNEQGRAQSSRDVTCGIVGEGVGCAEGMDSQV